MPIIKFKGLQLLVKVNFYNKYKNYKINLNFKFLVYILVFNRLELIYFSQLYKKVIMTLKLIIRLY